MLAAVALAGAGTTSLLGLAVDGLYDAPESTSTMLRAYDGVTLGLGVPLLAVSLRGRGLLLRLVRLGALAYLAYGFALAVLVTGFHDVFVLQLLVLGASVGALVGELAGSDVVDQVRRERPAARTAPVAVVLGLLGLGLGGMWLAASVTAALDGSVPEGSALVETDQVVHAGVVLDLVALVPAYLLAAVLLWRHRAWGYVLGAVVLVSGVLHQVGYVAALVVQREAEVPGATALDPAEVPIAVLFALGAGVLLLGVRRRGDRSCFWS